MIHVAMYAMAEKNRITAQKGFSTAKLEKALIGKACNILGISRARTFHNLRCDMIVAIIT